MGLGSSSVSQERKEMKKEEKGGNG